jgi:hypothetical protein
MRDELIRERIKRQITEQHRNDDLSLVLDAITNAMSSNDDNEKNRWLDHAFKIHNRCNKDKYKTTKVFRSLHNLIKACYSKEEEV